MQAKCKCGYVGEFTGYSERNVQLTSDDGNTWQEVTEVGIECPKCKTWFHSHYLNDKLKKLRAKVGNSPRLSYRKKYEREFVKVQKVLREKFGVAAPKFEKPEKEQGEDEA